MKIVFDCDGVLLNWMLGFRIFLEDKSYYPGTLNPSSYNLSNWIGTTRKNASILIDEFNHTEAFGRLAPESGMVMPNLRLLREAGHTLSIVTSCGDDTVALLRRRNLIDCFGDIFEDIHCLKLGECKQDALVKSKGDVWVEDNYVNAVVGHTLGYKTFMVNQRWNTGKVNSEITWMNDLWGPLMSM